MSTEPKKKVVKKKNPVVSKEEVDSDNYTTKTVKKFEDIEKLYNNSINTRFEIDVSPKSWVLPNRVKFSKNWLDTTFKYSQSKLKAKCTECTSTDEEVCPAIKTDSVNLFPHQKFIKDYIQFDSPYRGLLLYHGLGSGKSCSSIAAAELLMNHMDVIVMLPASLRGNYINEIKKCGRQYYNMKQRWVFIPTDTFSSNVQEVADLVKIDKELLDKHGGLWLPFNESGKKPNFIGMSSATQKQVIEQVDNIITNRFRFINYNGLKTTNITEMMKSGNPFDGKCIVVDEIHNLISRIVNGGKIGSALYKLLMSAKGCKLILLSGTPIINYPYEISYLINLLTGPQYKYIINVLTGSDDDMDTVMNKILNELPEIDNVNITETSKEKKTLTITILPRGFKYDNRKSLLVKRYASSSSAKDDNEIIQEFISLLKKHNITLINKKIITKEYKSLPEDDKEFNKYFVDMEQGKIINPRLFSRHVLGTVSYYSTYSPELYPKWEIEETNELMTDHQFHLYERARIEERKKESKSKSNKDTGNIFKDTGHVYRFYSRALCNFVFPEDIKRPYPSMTFLKNEIDDDEDNMKNLEKFAKDTDEEKTKNKQKEYDTLLQQVLDKLNNSDHLKLDNIGKYSPKFKKIIERVNEIKGTSLVYSQFRRVEGLGILSLALNKNGWAEFKIRKGKDGEWDIDIAEEDMTKPKYIVFTGNNEETQVLLKIFNSDRENMPAKIRDKLQELSVDGQVNNKQGSIIKLLMITQSGAEGISLKNVRSVHVLEPYWNYIRIDQVIGRAVRTCSHTELPPADRNVKVFIYNLKFTAEQLASSFTIRTQDKSNTTDEHIYNLAKKKATIVNMLLEHVKKSSVDCALNAKEHLSKGEVKCFAFPVNLDENSFAYQLDMNDETFDNQYVKDVEQGEWKGQVLVTKKGNFLIRPDTNEVYDYDLYLESGKLVRIGFLKIVGNEKHIVRNL